MGILINNKTRVVVQGMTGAEGSRATKEMIASGIHVSCGVTPGKAGKRVCGKRIFDSVAEAIQHDPLLNVSVLYVPPFMVYDAAMEAMKNNIKMIVIVTENVPIKDSALLVEYARNVGTRIIGPSSVGILSPRAGKLGSIASAKEKKMFTKGHVGIISKSGGMCAETALVLSQHGIGQSTVIGIGGDVIAGSTYCDLLELFEQDNETYAVVLFAEIGGTYEEQAAKMIMRGEFTKPVVAFVSGVFAQNIPRSLALGHAGAIIENGSGSADEKKKKFRKAGAFVTDYHYEIPLLVKKALAQRNNKKIHGV